MISNICRANFSGGRTAQGNNRFQWDYGQILEISGIENLPDPFTAQFSNYPVLGTAKTTVGTGGRVEIPNEYFVSGQNIYCFIVLHTDEDDGRTVYVATIPVTKRPKPIDDPITPTQQSTIDTAIAALQAGVARAEGFAGDAEEQATIATEAATTATEAAETATGAVADVEAAATRAEKAADGAETSATAAEASATGAETAKTAAETAAQGAAASASAASASATSAGQAAISAAQSATAAAGSATTAQGAAQTATTKAGEASASASAAAASETAAQSAQSAAETAATTATAKAIEAAASATAAAQAAASINTPDSALSDTSTNAVQNKVITGEVAQLKSALDILGSVSYTEYDGYIGGSGSIENPSASSQEKYTNKLSVREGDVLEITLDYPSTVGIWVAYATYGESGAFIGRYVIGDTNNTHFSGAVTIPSGVAFIVFTYRTWGSATRRITFLTDTYELGKSTIELKKITEPSNNLFGGTYIGFGNMELSNGKLMNTVADTYTSFYFTTQFRNNSTNVTVSATIPINFVGRVRLTVKATGNGNNITILHNGLSKNFVAIIPFNFVSGKTYTLSLNVEDYHVQEIGGLVLSDVQIEEGDANTPYIPTLSGIDYVAREIVNSNITERGLNVLLMGDSIFGNDGEIALFLDEMVNSCANGAFGGTRVTVRSDSSNGFRYFDGINIITALCTQTWTNQDTAAASLSSTYPWITARLTGLKNVDMSKIDLLIMDWGTNDYTAGQTIEAITDAYSSVIDKLQETYPKLRILITTPIWRYWGSAADNDNGDTKVYNVSTLKEIALAIEQFAKDKRISVLNAYRNLPLSYKTAATYFDPNDSTHLNTFGNRVYAGLLHGKIRSIY